MEREQALTVLGLDSEASLQTAEMAYQLMWDECNFTIDQSDSAQERLESLDTMQHLDSAVTLLRNAANQKHDDDEFAIESAETVMIPPTGVTLRRTSAPNLTLADTSAIDLELNHSRIQKATPNDEAHLPMDDEDHNPTLMAPQQGELEQQLAQDARKTSLSKHQHKRKEQTQSAPLDLNMDKTLLGKRSTVSAKHKAEHVLELNQTLINGRYTIQAFIDKGGMGEVYQAYDNIRRQEVAIKVLLPDLDKDAYERFFNEARLSSQLSHQNIVNVYDVQKDGELIFMSMELLKGENLRHRMRRHQRANEAMPQAEIHQLAIAMSSALQYAHKKIIHRDIKPENIWVCDNGEIKLMDFGIARTFSHEQAIQTRTVAGSVRYMAPEQLGSGDGSQMLEIDSRADQYALGVILYELLSNTPLSGRITPLCEINSDINEQLAEIVEKMLEGKADNRFASTKVLHHALKTPLSSNSLFSQFSSKMNKLAHESSKSGLISNLAPKLSRLFLRK
ncbi:MAG: serine/threonine-protein kinase [Gammaproteobacteria bacterium]|nr:serine/threonine-protein kinase [Gammaproteobacteria bacterium]